MARPGRKQRAGREGADGAFGDGRSASAAELPGGGGVGYSPSFGFGGGQHGGCSGEGDGAVSFTCPKFLIPSLRCDGAGCWAKYRGTGDRSGSIIGSLYLGAS